MDLYFGKIPSAALCTGGQASGGPCCFLCAAGRWLWSSGLRHEGERTARAASLTVPPTAALLCPASSTAAVLDHLRQVSVSKVQSMESHHLSHTLAFVLQSNSPEGVCAGSWFAVELGGSLKGLSLVIRAPDVVWRAGGQACSLMCYRCLRR